MIKKRSKIIKDLLMNKIDVLQAMQSLDFILEDINNDKIKLWLDNEINGYKNDDDVPEYRKIRTVVNGTVQVGYAVYNNINIPFVDKEAYDIFGKVIIKNPLSFIMQMSKAEIENENHALAMEVNTVLINKYQATEGDVINAHQKLGLYAFSNILASVKDKLLEIFKILEKNYGNLDDLYLDFSDDEKEEKVTKRILSIVLNDRSVNIGDNNEITNAKIGDIK